MINCEISQTLWYKHCLIFARIFGFNFNQNLIKILGIEVNFKIVSQMSSVLG